jgi:hypothetical protein
VCALRQAGRRACACALEQLQPRLTSVWTGMMARQSDNNMAAVAAGLLFNTGIVLSAVSEPTFLSRALIWAGVGASAKWAAGVLKVKQLDKKLASVGSAVARK